MMKMQNSWLMRLLFILMSVTLTFVVVAYFGSEENNHISKIIFQNNHVVNIIKNVKDIFSNG